MFAPSHGVPEDAATGGAAGPLTCHLCRHGLVPWGTEIEISQGEEIGRPSTLYARDGSGVGIERVEVGGWAVVVAHGEFRRADLAYIGELFSFVPSPLVSAAPDFGLGEALLAGKTSSHPAFVRFGARITEEGWSDMPADWAAKRP
jgi:hypothetical protein